MRACEPMCFQITHITACLITHITQIQALPVCHKVMSLKINPISELRTYYKRDRHTAVPQYVQVKVGANYFVSGMIYDRVTSKWPVRTMSAMMFLQNAPVQKQTITNITIIQALGVAYQLMFLQTDLITE